MRAYLVQGVGLDVRNLKGVFLEVAKILGAWEDAKLVTSTVSKKHAEQKAESRVPQIQLEDYEHASELFQNVEYEIADTQAPSKA